MTLWDFLNKQDLSEETRRALYLPLRAFIQSKMDEAERIGRARGQDEGYQGGRRIGSILGT